jgi:Concanavalin A-like lectin/glucanases superfamily/PKD domain
MKKSNFKYLALLATGIMFATSCKKEAVNQAPVANIAAISSATIDDKLTLDGSTSTDPEFGTLTYAWVLDSKPAGSKAAIENATTDKASFTPDVEGTYKVTLTVTDNGALTSTTSISLSVDYSVAGYKKSSDIATTNLIAYWPLNGDSKESISGTSAEKSINTNYVDAKKGKGANFTDGYLAFPELEKLKASLPSITVSSWVNVKNNGTAPACLFTLSRPGEWAGNFNVLAETGQKADKIDTLVVKGLLVSKVAGNPSFQDIINDPSKGGVQANKVAGSWIHLVVSYEGSSSLFKIYVNGVKISNPEWEKRGNTGDLIFTTPTKVILGAWQSVLENKAEAWQKPMNGQLDEVRVYNKALLEKDIVALYKLENKGL